MKYLKISSVLAGISLICALILAGMDMLTSPIIAKNNEQTEYETIVSIFNSYDKEKSEVVEGPYSSDYILSKILAKDSSGKSLGTIYTLNGKNAYGNIKLMVAIKDGEVLQVEFLENGQSFASTVNQHVISNYPSSEKNSIDVGFVSETNKYEGSLNQQELDLVDVKCGATYGAKLVKELVSAALNDAKGGK